MSVTEEKLKPDKSWMNGKIRKLLADRHFALSQHQHTKVVAVPACLALADYWGVGYISFLASWGLGGQVGLGLVAMCVLCLTVLSVAI